MSALAKQVEPEAETDVTRALRSVFRMPYRVVPPTNGLEHHLVVCEDRYVVVLAVLDGILIEDGHTGSWVGPGTMLDPAARLDAIRRETSSVTGIPSERVVPMLWLMSGLADPSAEPNPAIACSPVPEQLLPCVDELCRITVAPYGSSPDIARYFAGAGSMRASQVARAGGDSMRKLLKAVESSLRSDSSLGKTKLQVMGLEVTIDDLVNPSFLLPVLALCACEDWALATRKKTNGTGFSLDLEFDPTAILGYRLINVRPAVPYVVIAPMLAAAHRCRRGDAFVFDDLIRQFLRWAMKNGLDGDVLEDFKGQIGRR
jgi:hypothetical protein